VDQAPSHAPAGELALTPSDIRSAAVEGVISPEAAERLILWGNTRRAGARSPVAAPAVSAPATEQHRGLNLVTVSYYFGAMLMISACAWFLGDKWESLGSPGVFLTGLIYMAVAGGAGFWLRARGYAVAGGLLITVAVCLVPLVTYTIEDMLGLWPGDDPGAYKNYYPWIHGSWVVMELATIAASALALRFVKFGFLTAPMAFSFWFLSMDVTAWALGVESWSGNTRNWISIGVGLVTMLVGYGLDKTLNTGKGARSEDFAFWCYLFGLLAFWGGLSSMDSDSEVGRLVYALVNLGLIGVGVRLRRGVFLVFGALGVHVYLGHLAYRVFKDSFLFPFILALLGLSLILVTVWAQRRMRRLVRSES
jgi:hypothetical protein